MTSISFQSYIRQGQIISLSKKLNFKNHKYYSFNPNIRLDIYVKLYQKGEYVFSNIKIFHLKKKKKGLLSLAWILQLHIVLNDCVCK